jgi:hypothetical protein
MPIGRRLCSCKLCTVQGETFLTTKLLAFVCLLHTAKLGGALQPAKSDWHAVFQVLRRYLAQTTQDLLEALGKVPPYQYSLNQACFSNSQWY